MINKNQFDILSILEDITFLLSKYLRNHRLEKLAKIENNFTYVTELPLRSSLFRNYLHQSLPLSFKILTFSIYSEKSSVSTPSL